MEQLGVIGISWRQGGARALDRLTLPREERPERLPQIAREVGAEELVYLATCNRVEVALVARDGRSVAGCRPRLLAALTGELPRPGEAERQLRAWQGEGALEHLFLVACGLESARVGENEIVAQIRAAYESAREIGLVGPYLELVFEMALRVSRKVRGRSAIGNRSVSLAADAVDEIRQRLRSTPGRVALVGVAPMMVQCARELAPEGIDLLIVNRTLSRAEKLAHEVGGAVMALDEFRERPVGVEILALSTGASAPVLGRADLERIAAQCPSGRGPLVVDLAVPPDVAPEDAAAVGIPRVDLDGVIAKAQTHHDGRLPQVAAARLLVDEAIDGARQRLADRIYGPLFGALERRYRRTAVEGVERLLRKRVPRLSEADRDDLRRWAETLARRFAHLPVLGLRGLAGRAGPEAVQAFLDGLEQFDRALATELRAAARVGAPFDLDLEEVDG